MIKLDSEGHALFTIQGIINYAFVSLALFLPLLAFIIDLNRANQAMEDISGELSYISTHDPLTGLINRRSMKERIDHAVEGWKESKGDLSIIIGDIDNFKSVNDTYGHNTGDYVLSETAKIIQESVDENVSVCRWGGEEFLIMIEGDMETSRKIAENIRNYVEKHIYNYEDIVLNVTITQGIAMYNGEKDMEEVIKEADNRLYEGKQGTKNCVIA